MNKLYQYAQKHHIFWIVLSFVLLLLSQDLIWTVIRIILIQADAEVDTDSLSIFSFAARCFFGFMYLMITTLTNKGSYETASALLHRPVLLKTISALLIIFYILLCIIQCCLDRDHFSEIYDKYLIRIKYVDKLSDTTRVICAFTLLFIITIIVFACSSLSIRQIIAESYALFTALVGFALYTQGVIGSKTMKA